MYGYMVYKQHIYLPRIYSTGAAHCATTGIWVEEGDFKGCFYLPYSSKAQDTILLMRDSMKSAKKYAMFNNENQHIRNGILIYPNGDIVQLSIRKEKTNKPAVITGNLALPVDCIRNNIIRVGGSALPQEGLAHLMQHGNPVEDLFKLLFHENIREEHVFCFHIDDWPTIYKMFHDVPENRGRQFIHELKCRLNNPEYFEKST
jgi:hypothetical protein